MSNELTSIRKISLALQTSKGIFEDIFATNLSPIKPTLRKISDAKKAIPSIITALTRLEELEKVLRVIKPFLKNIRLEENEKGKYDILIDTITNDKPLVIARVNSKEEYDLLKEVLL